MVEENPEREKLATKAETTQADNAFISKPIDNKETPGDSNTAQPSSSNFHHHPTVLIDLDDEDKDFVDRSTSSYRSSRKRTWDTSSRTFIPQFSGEHANGSENALLIKDTIREDNTDDTSLIARSLNTILNGCVRFRSSILLICALSAFVVAVLACKRISELRFEAFKDEKQRTSHYFLYSLGVVVMLAAGIALSYTPVKSIVRSIRDYNRHNTGYEEI